jgi:hypothetical protein
MLFPDFKDNSQEISILSVLMKAPTTIGFMRVRMKKFGC